MGKFIGLATGCANGFTMPALWRHSCGGTDCYGDALWYAAQMHGFFAGCCGVSTSLQHLRCNCGSMVLRNVDTAVMRSVSNSASTFIHNCIADDEASVHHRACRLRCKVIAPMLQCCSIPLHQRSNMGAEVLHIRSCAMLICATQVFAEVCTTMVGAFRMMHSLLLLGKFQNAHEPVSVNTCSVQMQPQVEVAAIRSASHIRPVANVPIPYHSLISKLPPHAD